MLFTRPPDVSSLSTPFQALEELQTTSEPSSAQFLGRHLLNAKRSYKVE